VHADDAVIFLDRPEDDAIFRALFAFAPPNDGVSAQPAAEIAGVQLVKVRTQIEEPTFLIEGELPLHRQLRARNFAFAMSHGGKATGA
jgi:hypothetical protein